MMNRRGFLKSAFGVVAGLLMGWVRAKGVKGDTAQYPALRVESARGVDSGQTVTLLPEGPAFVWHAFRSTDYQPTVIWNYPSGERAIAKLRSWTIDINDTGETTFEIEMLGEAEP